MEIIIGYIIAWILFKLCNVWDKKFELFCENNSNYSQWTENRLGRKKIMLIIFFIPLINYLSGIFFVIYLVALFMKRGYNIF